jgi:hypothetical protein
MTAMVALDRLLATPARDLIAELKGLREQGAALDRKIGVYEQLLAIHESKGLVRRADVSRGRARNGRKRPPLPMWEVV